MNLDKTFYVCDGPKRYPTLNIYRLSIVLEHHPFHQKIIFVSSEPTFGFSSFLYSIHIGAV